MRPFEALITVEQAMRILLDEIRPVEKTELLHVEKGVGRVVSEDVVSSLDVPPFDRAAMDGYAVLASATAGATADAPVGLRCVERLYAGSVPEQAVSASTCAEIATGAPIPEGADAVIPVEQVQVEGEQIRITGPVKPGHHVTPRGADLREGERVVAADTVLTPARIGAVAAVGQHVVRVYRRPRVRIGATGNEVVSPGNPLRSGQIFDINSYSLHALFDALDCNVEIMPPCGDDVEAIKARVLDAVAVEADLIVLSGGSSVGEKDVLWDAFGALGEILFHGVAIKPGKPTMLARIQGKPVVGMPGYPTSCLSNGYLFLVPAVCKLARKPLPTRMKVRVPAAERLQSMADRHQVLTVRVENGRAARAFRESGVITSMSRADGFIEIPAGVDHVDAGQDVEVTLL